MKFYAEKRRLRYKDTIKDVFLVLRGSIFVWVNEAGLEFDGDIQQILHDLDSHSLHFKDLYVEHSYS